MIASVINNRMNGESSQIYHDGFFEGSSARTRPYSFDEILSRRKRKKLLKKREEISQDIPGDCIAQKLFDPTVTKKGKGYDKESCSGSHDHVSVKLKHKKMGSIIKENSANDDCLIGGLKKVPHSDTTPMVKTDRNLRNFVKSSIVRIHGNGSDERRSNTSAHGRRKTSELADKKKKTSKVDEKGRERIDMEKNYFGRWHDLENSREKDTNKIKEISNSHHEKLRHKRRRSRSQDGDFRIKSVSVSPREVKRAFYPGNGRLGVFSKPLKLRAGRPGYADSHGHFKRRHDGRSGLDEHLPEKGNSDDADNAMFPAKLAAEKRNAKWDLAPDRTGFRISYTTAALSATENAAASAVPIVSSVLQPFSAASSSAMSRDKFSDIDSIQLTQATRSMRRLYVENVPSTISKESLMECFNNFLISSGSNHIEGIQPCISCIMFKEKDQAMVEFLTPEDASAALSFDGCTIIDSVAKIRRPKDFVDIATGELEKSAAVIDDTSCALVNENMTHKVIVCGLSDLLTSEMLREIACVFGPLKTCYFKDKKDPNHTFAFLEYAEEPIAIRACAGLNGMKIGGKVITAAQVDPDVSLGDGENPPLLGIPENMKPLLETPTLILKLKNMFDGKMLYALTDAEIEEVLEDVRLECIRFGTVRSINVVKGKATTPSSLLEVTVANENGTSGEIRQSILPEELTTPAMEDVVDTMKDGTSQAVASGGSGGTLAAEQLAGSKPGHADGQSSELDAGADLKNNLDRANGVMLGTVVLDDGDGHIFQPGCVFVEFKRTEASRTAAHSLHGRSYEDRIVAVEFTPLAAYRTRFPN